MQDNETHDSILNNEDKNDVVMDLYKDFPNFSQTFLKKLKETFDIRKMCRYTDKVEYLRGVQDVLDFLDNVQKYKEE